MGRMQNLQVLLLPPPILSICVLIRQPQNKCVAESNNSLELHRLLDPAACVTQVSCWIQQHIYSEVDELIHKLIVWEGAVKALASFACDPFEARYSGFAD